MKSDFDSVPVVDVTKDNFSDVWPMMCLAVQKASYVALDLEMSGIGSRSDLMARSIEDRYVAMCKVANSRSIISFGLSCFKIDNYESDLNVSVQTFNITVLCDAEYTVEPKSLKFLVEHGFDFNKQYAKGVPYHRGDDQNGDTDSPNIRALFHILLKSKVPVVFHNAMVDLVFLYQNLYAECPKKMSQFIADLSEMYCSGVYDTKTITEFQARMPASYLEYVFRKCQKDNQANSVNKVNSVLVNFMKYPPLFTFIEMCNCSLPNEGSDNKGIALCESFLSHGWCSKGNDCPKSHDIDAILNAEKGKFKKKKKRQKRKRKNPETFAEIQIDDGEDDTMEQDVVDPGLDKLETESEVKPPEENQSNEVMPPTEGSSCVVSQARSRGHRAGFDAFMTGFILAYYIVKYGNITESDTGLELGLIDFCNKVYLSGKDIPLQITKSAFTKISRNNREKIDKYS